MSSVLCDKQEAASANEKKVDAATADKKHSKRGIYGEGYGGGDFGGHDFGGGDFGGHDFDDHHHHHHVHHEKTIVNVKKVKRFSNDADNSHRFSFGEIIEILIIFFQLE